MLVGAGYLLLSLARAALVLFLFVFSRPRRIFVPFPLRVPREIEAADVAVPAAGVGASACARQLLGDECTFITVVMRGSVVPLDSAGWRPAPAVRLCLGWHREPLAHDGREWRPVVIAGP